MDVSAKTGGGGSVMGEAVGGVRQCDGGGGSVMGGVRQCDGRSEAV